MGLTRRVGLMTNTVDGNHRKTVGYGMTTLDGRPCLALTLLLFVTVAALITYGGGVDEKLGTGKGHQPGGLGIPLVPAHHHAQTTYTGVDGHEPQVAGGEVELLIVGGVVGDVHLAVAAGNAAVSLKHYGGVVIQAGGTTLEERGHQYHVIFLGQLSEKGRRWAGDGLSQVEHIDIFGLTEIERVVQFLQNDELRALLGERGDVFGQTLLVGGGIGSIVLLHNTYLQLIH